MHTAHTKLGLNLNLCGAQFKSIIMHVSILVKTQFTAKDEGYCHDVVFKMMFILHKANVEW